MILSTTILHNTEYPGQSRIPAADRNSILNVPSLTSKLKLEKENSMEFKCQVLHVGLKQTKRSWFSFNKREKSVEEVFELLKVLSVAVLYEIVYLSFIALDLQPDWCANWFISMGYRPLIRKEQDLICRFLQAFCFFKKKTKENLRKQEIVRSWIRQNEQNSFTNAAYAEKFWFGFFTCKRR